MEEIRMDLRIPDEERSREGKRTTEWIYRFNQAMPGTPESAKALNELFHGRIGEGTRLNPPFYCNLAENITIGKNCSIMPYCKCMSAGKITIEDDVLIALNTTIITNNHDMVERRILTIKDVRIKKGAWIGAGSTILPGVTIGKFAVVGAGSIVTKDIPDFAVAVGSPARVIRMLDPKDFEGK